MSEVAHWVTDGSEGFLAYLNTITHTNNEKDGGVDDIFNAMWLDGNGETQGAHYWTMYFPVLVHGAGVGFTSNERFTGVHCRFIEYLGNLSDGTTILVANFGRRIKQGDTIGMLAVFAGDRLKTYFSINGKSLGLAFNVPASTFTSIFPVVSFKGTGTAICTKQPEIADITDRAPFMFIGIQGDWELTKLEEFGVPLNCICTPTCKITLISPENYSLYIDVINRIGCKVLHVLGSVRPYEAFKSKINTAEIPNAGFEHLEHAIIGLIKGIEVAEIDAAGILWMRSNAITTSWKRYDATPAPFIGDPFARYTN